MKVSVIIPVYNVEPWLRDCLDSVINQTLKDFEIICINDASTDDSLLILDEYATKDTRIKVVSLHENKGVSIARNIGICKATGEYLYFFDGDDILKKNALELLYYRAKKDTLDIIFFNWETFYEKDIVNKTNKKCNRLQEYPNTVSGKSLFMNMSKNKDYRVLVCNLMVDRNFILENKINFIPGIIYEDNAFTFECILKAERACHIGEVLYLRRVRASSITTVNKAFRHAYGYFRSSIAMIELLDKIELDDDEKKLVMFEINKKFMKAKKIFKGLRNEEKLKYNMLPLKEHILFKEIIVNTIRGNVNKQLKELKDIKNGWSFKIGRILTWLPRRVLGRK